MSTATPTGPAQASVLDRIAGAPISWGVCEVPGWGVQLPPALVLAEMSALGVAATEAGPDGYLGADAGRVRALLAEHGLRLVGGFLPLVLHDPARLGASLAKVHRTAAFFAALGADVVCTALVLDDDWSPPRPLDGREWAHLLQALPLVDEAAAEHAVVQALHPHWGTLVERDADVRRVLEESPVRICLDTGHLALGGSDAVAIAEAYASRVAHVHLKDVDAALAARLRAGELGLVDATRRGLFRPLGAGGARVDEVVSALECAGYGGWYVLEQDTALAGAAPGEGPRPRDDVDASIEFLRHLARRPEGGEAAEATQHSP
jgi:inosose dehydratase